MERCEKQRIYKANRLKSLVKVPLTQTRLKEVLHYDPETGVFTRIGLSGKRSDLVGSKVNSMTSDGYVRVAVDDVRYRAHRLAWFYMTGEWPDEIDHVDGCRTNNRWNNLRNVDSKLNKQNRRSPNKGSVVPLLGVSMVSSGRFRARIDDDHIGVFDSADLAYAAYLKEKRQRHKGSTL